MAVTYGELRYCKPERGHRVGTWAIDAQPHLVIRLKRVFPRVRTGADGTLLIADNLEVARDLDWVNGRWPLAMDRATKRALNARCRAHRASERAVAAILSGEHVDHGTDFKVAAEPTRPYQQPVLDMITTMKRVLVTDDLGLGKTHESALTLRNPGALPALVVAPTHLPMQWQAQLNTIWPDLRVHIAKKGTPYDFAKYGGAPDVLIMNYAKLAGWRHELAGQIRTLILDEAQDLRRGQHTDKGAAAAHIAAQALYVVGTTATPVINYAGEVHSILDIISPGALGTRDEFLREWGGSSWVTSSGDQQATVANPRALSIHLRASGLMIGRTRDEVGRELPYGQPVKVPHVIDADTSILQEQSGDAVELAKLILARTTDQTTRWRTSGELDTLLRQATGIAKAPFVAAFVKALLDTEERVVLWGWHHAVYDLWRQALTEFNPAFYTGQESPAQKHAALTSFTAGQSRVLIMSLRSGSGIDGLQHHCKVGVFGELDWSPKMHDQALGRLARDGQEHEVVGYYLMADHGADPKIAEVLNIKQQQAAPIENPNVAPLAALPDAGTRMRDLAVDLLRQNGIDPAEFTSALAS